jgi:hypothetical protein
VRLLGLIAGLSLLGAIFLLTEPQARLVSLTFLERGLGPNLASFLGGALWFGLLAWAFAVVDDFICTKLDQRSGRDRNEKR